MKSHINVYARFCHSVGCSPFPVEIKFLICYVAYLTISGRTYGTIINHTCSWLYQLENYALKKQANEELFRQIREELEDILRD